MKTNVKSIKLLDLLSSTINIFSEGKTSGNSSHARVTYGKNKNSYEQMKKTSQKLSKIFTL
ncbi:hypothetical protein [Alkaliphilus sp. B6464]|uniref:hypothetical protein n=1 Tax=Alkaliphilus sp. B6464 TaxID=2731219 RepID=UPI001BADF08B|nr:hypothetical protein [Alkaliphilus sp. B6464]QUH21800.1 hypothetical protein HYG84_17850 [Alkaliphilus sp. B6464]